MKPINKNIIYIESIYDVHKCGVYKLFHISNEANIYIGSTRRHVGRKGNIGFAARFGNHIASFRKGSHHSRHLQALVNKLGLDGLRMQILEICDPGAAIIREQYYIDALNPVFNACPNSANSTGYKHSPAAIIKMSLRQKGQKLSETHRKNISNGMKGKRPKNIEMLWSKEVRNKVAGKLKGRKKPQHLYDHIVKAIGQYSIDGGLLREYRSMHEASIETGIDRGSINNCALGNRKSAGGFHWKYISMAKKAGLSKSRLAK
jgi:group I intron endonuclease